MTLKGILFDLDGTLFPREAVFWSWFAAEAAGVALDWAEVTRLARDDRRRMALIALLAQAASWPERSLELQVQRARQGMLQLTRPDPRLQALLTRLQRELRLGLVSNGSGPAQRAKLRALQLEHCFDPIVLSGELGHRKPELAIFQHAARQWPFAPAEILFVGDDPLADIAGARAAGMLPLHVLGEPSPAPALLQLGPLPALREPASGAPHIPSIWHLEPWLEAQSHPRASD